MPSWVLVKMLTAGVERRALSQLPHNLMLGASGSALGSCLLEARSQLSVCVPQFPDLLNGHCSFTSTDCCEECTEIST